MKTNIKFLSGLVLSMMFFLSPFAQESDYQIKSNFGSELESINLELNKASNTVTIDSLKSEIQNLYEAYSSNKSLLDNALFPNSFESEILSLKQLLTTTEQRLLIIENQNERIYDLSNEISNYETEINFLTERSDSLSKAISSSMLSEKQLKSLVRRYRENLEQRDELIMDIVDSLMFSQSSFSSSGFYELSKQPNSGKIIQGNNPLMMIMNLLENNIDVLSNSSKALSVEDHLRMYAVQKHFEKAWNKVGSEMLNNYGGANKKAINKEIQLKLKDWRMASAQNMWNSMNNYLEMSTINLGAFDNNNSFYVALDQFVSKSRIKSEEEFISSGSYNDFQRFNAFWSTKVKNEWSSMIHETDLLTIEQISTIDEQITNWEKTSKPVHPLIIILSVLTVISLAAFFLIMYKAR